MKNAQPETQSIFSDSEEPPELNPLSISLFILTIMVFVLIAFRDCR